MTRRGDRDRDRDRPRRRTRSKSRSKSRSRTPSPFSAAMDKWEKLKKEEKAMLTTLKRKQEIYDKRPEDLPSYPEEWRAFWEKRYKELQLQGKDADKHDYKTEWIPFWGKRIEAIYQQELKDKTEQLLKRHGAETMEKPLRADYPRRPPPKRSLQSSDKVSGTSYRKERLY